MSKGSKRTKKASVSKDSKRTKQSTVSNDSKPTEQVTDFKGTKPTERVTVFKNSKPTEQGAVSKDSKPTEQGAVFKDSKSTEQGTAGETFFDFTKLMSQFQLPGVDFAALVDRERKNIQALAEAIRIAFEGWQRLGHRQAEIFQETMMKVVAEAGQVDPMKRADLAKEGFEKALANMRELADMGSKSQREAFEVVRKRIEENVEDVRNLGEAGR